MLLNAVQFVLELFFEITGTLIKCDGCVVGTLNNEVQNEVHDAEHE